MRCPPPAAGLPPVIVMIDSRIPGILAPFVAADRAVGPLLGLLYVSLAVIGAVVVLLGAWLVAEHRPEFALMRARGGALGQLGWLVLRGSAVVAVAAGAAAAAFAIRITPGNGIGELVAGRRHGRGHPGRAGADQCGPAPGAGSGDGRAGSRAGRRGLVPGGS